MMEKNNQIAAQLFRYIGRIGGLLSSITLITFTAMSASPYLDGIFKVLEIVIITSPWLLLLLIVLISWRYELVGGALIVLFAITFSAYLIGRNSIHDWIIITISTIIALLGASFILSAQLRKTS